ncbi:MAG: hypothetical protein LC722_00120 [Actinobacteria bacterium]|nr:hypothetical protein [Actinomycetota bacterium]
MVKPRLAWLYVPGNEDIPKEGTLTLSAAEGVLDFQGESGRTFRVELAKLAKVKRLRASPVLQIRFRDADGKRRVAFFYFTSPPALGSWRGSPWTREEKKGRRQGFSWLEERNSEIKDELKTWVAEIRDAAKRS